MVQKIKVNFYSVGDVVEESAQKEIVDSIDELTTLVDDISEIDDIEDTVLSIELDLHITCKQDADDAIKLMKSIKKIVE